MTLAREKPGFNAELHIMRALGIMLVVFGHALEPFLDLDGARTAKAIIYAFHMPLFFAIAGFFGGKFLSADAAGYWSTIVRQAKRLLVPYAFCSAVVVAAKLIPSLGAYADRPLQAGAILPTVLLYPGSHPMIVLWFVYVLFLLEVSLLTVNRLLKIDYGKWSSVVLVAAVFLALNLASGRLGTPLLGIDRLLNLGVFFFAGCLAGRYYGAIADRLRTYRYLALMPAVAYIGYFQWNVYALHALLYAVVGILATWAIACLLREGPGRVRTALYVVADNAYGIYLYSYFVHVALRMVLIQHLHWVSPWALATFFLASLVLPIVLSVYVLRKNRLLAGVTLGEWRAAKPKP